MTRVDFEFGDAFQGIKKATLTNFSGTFITGTIDGRLIEPFPAGQEPEAFQFQDGQPAPNMSLHPEMAQQLKRLFALAEAKAKRCESAAGSRSSDVSAQDVNNPKCIGCKAACAGGDVLCLSEIKGACAPLVGIPFVGPGLFAACIAVGVGSCTGAGLICADLCREASFCCPVPCGHEPDATCCEQGESCLVAGGVGEFRCCPAGQAPCQGRFCCPSADRCMPNGMCCVQPDFPCGQNCCGLFTDNCCNGVCCNGECINGVCCTSPSALRQPMLRQHLLQRRLLRAGPVVPSPDRPVRGDLPAGPGVLPRERAMLRRRMLLQDRELGLPHALRRLSDGVRRPAISRSGGRTSAAPP